MPTQWTCRSLSVNEAGPNVIRLLASLLVLVCALGSGTLTGIALCEPAPEPQPCQSDSLLGTPVLTEGTSLPGGHNLPFHPARAARLASGGSDKVNTGVAPTAGATASPGVSPPFQIGQDFFGPAERDQRCVAVAYGAGSYLAVWSDARSGTSDLYGARVSSSGEVLDGSGIPICTEIGGQSWPSVSFDGSNFLVVWEDGRSPGSDIYCSLVSPAGIVLTPGGISVSSASGYQLRPTVSFDGANYLVAWQDSRSGSLDIYGTRLSQALSVLDPAGIPICVAAGDQYYPEAAFCSGGFMVVWQDLRSGTEWDVYGSRVSAAGSVLDPAGIPILTGYSHQWVPDIASDGTAFLVAWADGRATGSDTHSDIYGTRVDVSGVVLDPGGFAVSTAALMQHWPAVAYDGANYVIAWEDKRSGSCDTYAARVNSSGAVIDPSGILVCSATDEQYYPAVASEGAACLVVWDDHRFGTDWNIFGTPLAADGSVAEPDGVLISSKLNPNSQYFPAVAFDGTNYLVVWDDTYEGPLEIFAARVDSLGNVLDVNSIPVSTAPGDQAEPTVAFDGTNYFVVWEDLRSATEWDIYGARVSTSGVVLDPAGIPICTAVSHQWCPSVAFDGTNYLVVWGDARSSGTDQQADIYGTRVTTAGVVLDPAGIAIGVALGSQMWPKLAFDGANHSVVWQDTRGGNCDIYGARVTPSGTVLDPAGIPISTAAVESYMPAIAFDGTDYLVVWEDNRTGVDFGIYGTKLTRGGLVLNPGGITISDAAYHQLEPCVAFDGCEYVVAWQDLRSGIYYDVYATRVSRAGTVLDGGGVLISTGPEHELKPAVASARLGSFLLAYACYTAPSPGSAAFRIVGNIWTIETGGPTPVLFSWVKASAQSGCVTLAWRVSTDLPSSAFSILRSGSVDGQFTALDVLILRSAEGEFSCSDRRVAPGQTYWYKIVAGSGTLSESFGPIEVAVACAPPLDRVGSPYPNPFNPLCTIPFELAAPGQVVIRIYDVSGTVVKTLVNGWRTAGAHEETWDGRSDLGSPLPSGVYLYELEARDLMRASGKIIMSR